MSEAQSKQRLKVAAVLGITGGAAAQAEAVLQGINLAAQELRDDGWDIDLKIEDDQTNPAKTVSAVQGLIARGYWLIVGPMWSFQINAARSTLEQDGVVALVPTSSSDINGGPSEQILNLCPKRRDQKPLVRDWLAQHSFHRVLLLTPLGDWGVVHNQLVGEAVAEAGALLVGNEEFSYGIDAPTARSMLLKHRAAKPDAVFITGAPGDVAVLARAMKELKFPSALLSTEDLSDAVSLDVLKREDLPTNSFTVGLETDAEFVRRYKETHGETPKLYADRGYRAVKMAAEASQTAATPAAVASALRKNFDSNGDSIDGRYVIEQLR